MSERLLHMKELRVGYRLPSADVVLFHQLCLSLHSGEMVCFMGPNGIGKSSLIRTLCGLQPALSGSIELSVRHKRFAEAISVVLTDRISGGTMTSYDLVAFGRYPYLNWNVSLSLSDQEIIDRAFDQVNINHLRNAKLSELSDGQLQMVMIARAFAQDTPIILLDEPTAHLDLNNRVEIMKLLKRLARTTQRAILVSTHELDLALQMADSIWLAGRERNIFTGIPEDLVLQGAFDSIFKFKGFDLKTGRVQHDIHQSEKIGLIGRGPEYLWTKNALERNGYEVSTEKQNLCVSVKQGTEELTWELDRGGNVQSFKNLQSLLKSL